MPSAENGVIFDVIAQLPASVAVLIIEHDMELVFRFAQRITVLVQGAILIEGTPAEIAADPHVREVYLGERRLDDCLTLPCKDVRRLWRDGRARRRFADVDGRRHAVDPGRNGVGKTTLLASVLGHTTLHAGEIAFAGRPIAGMRPFRRARLGIGYVPQEREIFPSLDVEENLTVATRGPRAATAGRWNGSMRCSRASPSAAAAWATSSPAASSRCWRSAAR